jgi:DNA-binding response OmpR family regulator
MRDATEDRMGKELLDVLVVEDDAVDYKAVERALARYQEPAYALHRAESMEKGKRMLEDHTYDAVILDLGLPDVQGMDSVIHLHANAPATPIVVLTGQGDSQTASGAVSMGAEDFLLKSDFYPDRLVEKLRLAMQRKQARLTQLQNTGAAAALADAPEPRTLDSLEAVLPLRSALLGVEALAAPVQGLEREQLIGHRLRFVAKAGGSPVDEQVLDLARLAGTLPDLSLACLRGALAWVDRQARSAIHMDVEMEALTMAFAAKVLAEIPDASLRKRFRFFLPARSPELLCMQAEPALKTLRNAGLNFGLRDVGGGGTVMETLGLLQPAWLRLSDLLCEGVGKTKGRRLQLQQWIEMLEPLKTPLLADQAQPKDLQVLRNLGLLAAVLAPE